MKQKQDATEAAQKTLQAATLAEHKKVSNIQGFLLAAEEDRDEANKKVAELEEQLKEKNKKLQMTVNEKSAVDKKVKEMMEEIESREDGNQQAKSQIAKI